MSQDYVTLAMPLDSHALWILELLLTVIVLTHLSSLSFGCSYIMYLLSPIMLPDLGSRWFMVCLIYTLYVMLRHSRVLFFASRALQSPVVSSHSGLAPPLGLPSGLRAASTIRYVHAYITPSHFGASS